MPFWHPQPPKLPRYSYAFECIAWALGFALRPLGIYPSVAYSICTSYSDHPGSFSLCSDGIGRDEILGVVMQTGIKNWDTYYRITAELQFTTYSPIVKSMSFWPLSPQKTAELFPSESQQCTASK